MSSLLLRQGMSLCFFLPLGPEVRGNNCPCADVGDVPAATDDNSKINILQWHRLSSTRPLCSVFDTGLEEGRNQKITVPPGRNTTQKGLYLENL